MHNFREAFVETLKDTESRDRQPAAGLAVNTPVAVLQKKIDQFSFFGFGWDYSGVITQGNPTLDQYRQRSGLNFTMAIAEPPCQKLAADCQAVSGEAEISSDNPHLVPLKAHISQLSVRLE
jgi:hypothetical protein